MIIIKLNLPSKPKQKLINDYSYQINIDTIVLRAKLTHQQIDSIFDYFHYNYRPSKKYWYNAYLKEYGLSIQIHPKEPTLHVHFNTTITLTPSFFSAEYIPYSILDILKMLPFSVTRMDIATDFPYQYADNVLLFKHHGNAKEFIYRNESKYVGSKTARFKAVSYDRNQKEKSRGNNINHIYSNRIETRLRFKMNEQPINNINHDLISEQLAKVIYIPSIDNLKLDGWTKNTLRKIHNDSSLLKQFTDRQRRDLRKYVKISRTPLDEIYKANIDTIYQFLTYKEYHQQQAI